MIEPVSLAQCPIGLFVSVSGELCLKTEYGNNEGRIDAYIVSTGEFFWGAAPQTIENQRAQLVQPVETVTLHKRPVAFRIEIGEGHYLLFSNEEWASEYADKHGLEYAGLYDRNGDGVELAAK